MSVRYNILLIEDEFTLGEIVKESLESRGFAVKHFVSGQEGIQYYFQNGADLFKCPQINTFRFFIFSDQQPVARQQYFNTNH